MAIAVFFFYWSMPVIFPVGAFDGSVFTGCDGRISTQSIKQITRVTSKIHQPNSDHLNFLLRWLGKCGGLVSYSLGLSKNAYKIATQKKRKRQRRETKKIREYQGGYMQKDRETKMGRDH
eukprot:GEMP01116076.1.p1 GENE.GEMP01116076.1~~GEMP01116076.1.p1  ORF type:complete len:120 (-),score=3.31 GEMP01116076.1:15-374(-)